MSDEPIEIPQTPLRRNVVQYKPKGSEPTAPMYAPQRDVAYLYSPALREAMRGLLPANLSAEVLALMAGCGLTAERLGAALAAYADAHARFVNDPTVGCAMDALNAAGFQGQPLLARLLIYARLGEVMTAGFLIAVRDVTMAGEMPHQATELPELVALGRALGGWLAQLPGQVLEVAAVQRIEAECQLAQAALDRQIDETNEWKRRAMALPAAQRRTKKRQRRWFSCLKFWG
jgi:hypothetical protein